MYDPNTGQPLQQTPTPTQNGEYNQYPLPPVQPFYMQPPVAPHPLQGTAITGFVLNIFSIVCCYIPIAFIPGIICSIIAFAKGNRSGISIAGLVLGIIGTLLSLLYMIFVWLFMFSEPGFWENFQNGYNSGYNYGFNFGA